MDKAAHKKFPWGVLYKKICIDPQQRGVSVSENKYGGCVIFTVGLDPYWVSEDINLHVEKIKEYVEKSKKKFEELRK